MNAAREGVASLVPMDTRGACVNHFGIARTHSRQAAEKAVVRSYTGGTATRSTRQELDAAEDARRHTATERHAALSSMHAIVRGVAETSRNAGRTATRSASARCSRAGASSATRSSRPHCERDVKEKIGLEHTLLVITADHGESHHGPTLYDDILRVPLLSGATGIAARRLPQNVSLVDVAPTILELTGAEPLPGAAGRSLAPLLRGESFERPRRAIVEGRFKLVFGQRARTYVLYDLERDPYERDIVTDAHLDVTRRLAGLMGVRLRERPPSGRVADPLVGRVDEVRVRERDEFAAIPIGESAGSIALRSSAEIPAPAATTPVVGTG
jgi:hypothetical protein